MRLIVIPIFLILCLKGFSQNGRQASLSIVGAYQFYDKQSLSLGVEYKAKTIWPKVNFESFYESELLGEWFLTDPSVDNIFAIDSKLYWATKYVGIGYDLRLIFQGDLQRLDFGPALKIGYKFVWLEYSVNFLMSNNFINYDADKPTIDFENMEQSLNLTLSIPIIKFKK